MKLTTENKNLQPPVTVSTVSHLLWPTLQFIAVLLLLGLKETLKDIEMCFGTSVLLLCLYWAKQNCNISRPLSGLPLILSLVVLAPKIVCFYTSPCLKSGGERWPPPSAPPGSKASPLTPARQAALPWDTPGGQLAAIGVSIGMISFTNNQIG